MRGAMYHLHRRKRASLGLEEYPHPDPLVRRLDDILLVAAIGGPLMNIPQIIKIFSAKNASGVSGLSFLLFAVFNIPWIVYGIIHKEKTIVLANTLWLVTNLAVLAGTRMYG